MCFKLNKMNSNKILNKLDKFYNDAYIIKIKILNKIK